MLVKALLMGALATASAVSLGEVDTKRSAVEKMAACKAENKEVKNELRELKRQVEAVEKANLQLQTMLGIYKEEKDEKKAFKKQTNSDTALVQNNSDGDTDGEKVQVQCGFGDGNMHDVEMAYKPYDSKWVDFACATYCQSKQFCVIIPKAGKSWSRLQLEKLMRESAMRSERAAARASEPHKIEGVKVQCGVGDNAEIVEDIMTDTVDPDANRVEFVDTACANYCGEGRMCTILQTVEDFSDQVNPASITFAGFKPSQECAACVDTVLEKDDSDWCKYNWDEECFHESFFLSCSVKCHGVMKAKRTRNTQHSSFRENPQNAQSHH